LPGRFLKTFIPVITVTLFILAVFLLVIPTMQNGLMEQKRQKIRDLTQSIWHILESNEAKERSGQMTREEAQAHAVEEVSRIRYGEEEKDYFWICDLHPTMITHPYLKELVGKDVTCFRDRGGKLIFAEFIKAVSGPEGCGYVDYMWQRNDDPVRIMPKISFVKVFKPWGWIVGTGIYIDDLKAEIGAVTNRFLMATGGILLFILILHIYMLRQNLERERERLKAEEALRNANDELEGRVEERTSALTEANDALQQEIVDRCRAEDSLEESRLLLEQIFNSIKSAVFVLHIEQPGSMRIIKCNAAASAIFGYEADEMTGHPIDVLYVDEASVKVFINYTAAAVEEKGFSHLAEFNMVRKGGEVFPAEQTVTPMMDDNGKCTGWVSVIRDITDKRKAETERRKLEVQLFQAQKLESIGDLASGIAHEINTPIQYVGDNTEFLLGAFNDLDRLLQQYDRITAELKQGAGPEKVLSLIESANREADLEYLRKEIPRAITQSSEGVAKVIEVVRAMKEFSNPGILEKKLADLNRIIENTVIVARNEWKYVADMVMDLDQSLPPVPCLPGELNQVILNMIVNAARSIAEKAGSDSKQRGKITVKTCRSNGHAEIQITDTGTGIPENIRTKIFDPHFTTRKAGAGHGLAIAQSVIVEKHQGKIDFESETGKGTTFVIKLPMGN